MLKQRFFEQSLRTNTSEVLNSIHDEDHIRQAPEKIRQNKLTKTYNKLECIPLEIHVPTLNPSNIQHLYLSHNNIQSLSGIDSYTNLLSLNVSYNRLHTIEELQMITYPLNLTRIGLKMNHFIYGYQDYVVKIFKNLKKLDDVSFKNRNIVQQMWKFGENVACNFLQFYIRIERLLFFMDDLITKNKLHSEMKLSQSQSKYSNPQLKHLFEHVSKVFISTVSSNFLLPNEHQFRNLQSIQILKKIQNIISLSLSEQIDLKCTCRPRLPIEDQIKQAFQSITQIFLEKFHSRFNTDLDDGLKKIEKKMRLIYPDRNWQKWELFGLLQNYVELSSGGKNLSQIMALERPKFNLFEEIQLGQALHKLVGKSEIKDESLWRNKIFGFDFSNFADQKQNISPNLPLINSLKQSKKQKIIFRQRQAAPMPEMFYNRIPMIIYEKNYLEILLQITMEKIQQLLSKYDFLVKKHSKIVSKTILRVESEKETAKIQQTQRKWSKIKDMPFLKTKRQPFTGQTQRHSERMLQNTLQCENQASFKNELLDQAKTTVHQFLSRKDSEISFGLTDNNQLQDSNIHFSKNEKIYSKTNVDAISNIQKPNKSAESYQYHEINLAFKVFRSLKLRVMKKRAKRRKIFERFGCQKKE